MDAIENHLMLLGMNKELQISLNQWTREIFKGCTYHQEYIHPSTLWQTNAIKLYCCRCFWGPCPSILLPLFILWYGRIEERVSPNVQLTIAEFFKITSSSYIVKAPNRHQQSFIETEGRLPKIYLFTFMYYALL